MNRIRTKMYINRIENQQHEQLERQMTRRHCRQNTIVALCGDVKLQMKGGRTDSLVGNELRHRQPQAAS